MLHPLFVWAICTEHPVCSLLLRLFHTSQTAVASIPRHSLSGIREMRSCSRLSVFALACLPTCLTTCPYRVCGCLDPAWPARLLTRACMVSEHLRDQIHSLYEPLLPQLVKSGNSAMDDSTCKHLVVCARNRLQHAASLLSLYLYVSHQYPTQLTDIDC